MVLQERYRIVRLLGEGGMGAVYEAEHILIKKRVAVKCLHAQYAQNPEVVARFHREALAATSIGHQNIIEVTDMGRFPDGAVFMVLEYLQGRDFAALIDDEGPQQLGRVVHIMTQICDALSAAHSLGIVHRDLKPENVYLIRRGEDADFVKVLDFGISKMKSANDSPGSGMTRTGMALGTPYYMAPEQAQGKKDVDHRADIYALGVIVFRALTGHHPFDHDSYPMLVLKICTEPPPPLRLYRPDLPPELEQVVGKLLAKDPSERYQDCAAVKAALAPFKNVTSVPIVQEVGRNDALPLASIAALTGARQPTPQAVPVMSATPLSTMTPAGSVPGLPTRSNLPIVLGLGAVLLLGAGGVGVAFATGVIGGGSTEASHPPPPQIPQLVLPTPQLPPTAPQLPPGAPAMVNVKLTTDPAPTRDTVLMLDGDRVALPLDADLPMNPEPQTIRVERPGYITVVQDLVLRFPQRIVIQMERGSGVRDTSTHRHHDTTVGHDNPGTPLPPPQGNVGSTTPDPGVVAPPTHEDRPATHEDHPAAHEDHTQTTPPPPPDPGVVAPPPPQGLKRLHI